MLSTRTELAKGRPSTSGTLVGHARLLGDRVDGSRKPVVAGCARGEDLVGALGFGERQVAGRQGHAEQVVGDVGRACPAAAPVVDLGKADLERRGDGQQALLVLARGAVHGAAGVVGERHFASSPSWAVAALASGAWPLAAGA